MNCRYALSSYLPPASLQIVSTPRMCTEIRQEEWLKAVTLWNYWRALGGCDCVLDGKVVASMEQRRDHMREEVFSSKLRISYICDVEKKVPEWIRLFWKSYFSYNCYYLCVSYLYMLAVISNFFCNLLTLFSIKHSLWKSYHNKRISCHFLHICRRNCIFETLAFTFSFSFSELVVLGIL